MPEWNRKKFCSRSCINKGRVPHNKYIKYRKCLNCNIDFKPDHNYGKYCSTKCASTTLFQNGHIPWHNGTKGLGVKKQRRWKIM